MCSAAGGGRGATAAHQIFLMGECCCSSDVVVEGQIDAGYACWVSPFVFPVLQTLNLCRLGYGV